MEEPCMKRTWLSIAAYSLCCLYVASNYAMDQRQSSETTNNTHYIDFQKVFFSLADVFTDEEITSKKFLKAFNDSLNFEKLPELAHGNSEVLRKYINFAQVRCIASKLIDEQELDPDDMIDLMHVEQLSILIGCQPAELEQYIKVKKLARKLIKLLEGKKVTKQELLKNIDFIKIKAHVKDHTGSYGPDYLKDYLDFEKAITGFIDTLVDQETHYTQVLIPLNDALNMHKLSELIAGNPELVDRYIKVEKIKSLVNNGLKGKGITPQKALTVINIEPLASSLGCDTETISLYVDMDQLAQLIITALTNNKPLTKKDISKAFKTKTVRAHIKDEKRLKEYFNFKNTITKLMYFLADRELDTKKILKLVNQATNYGKLVTSLGFEINNIGNYINVEQIRPLVDATIDKKPLTGKRTVKIININTIAHLLGCDTDTVSKYINLEEFGKIIVDRCLGRRVILEQVERACNFESIHADFGSLATKVAGIATGTYILHDPTAPTSDTNGLDLERTFNQIRHNIHQHFSQEQREYLQGIALGVGVTTVPFLVGRTLCLPCAQFLQPAGITAAGLGFAATYGIYKAYQAIQEPTLLKNVTINAATTRVGSAFKFLIGKLKRGSHQGETNGQEQEAQQPKNLFQQFKETLTPHQKQQLSDQSKLLLAEFNPFILVATSEAKFIASLEDDQMALLSIIIEACQDSKTFAQIFIELVSREQKAQLTDPSKLALDKFNPFLVADETEEEFLASLTDTQGLLLSAVIQEWQTKNSNNT
jgi:hypothetical protein